jgi:hypothetical protein
MRIMGDEERIAEILEADFRKDPEEFNRQRRTASWLTGEALVRRGRVVVGGKTWTPKLYRRGNGECGVRYAEQETEGMPDRIVGPTKEGPATEGDTRDQKTRQNEYQRRQYHRRREERERYYREVAGVIDDG